MNEKALRILEYNKVTELLMNYAHSPMAKSLCKQLKPSTDLIYIKKSGQETFDALSRIYKQGNLTFSGLTDVTPSLKRLEIGASIGAGELLSIARLLEITLHAKSYQSGNERDEITDSLTSLFQSLSPLSPLCHEIKRCIISEEEISDDASSSLKSIRRSMKQTNDKIKNQLNQIIANQNNRGMLQDSIVTMRNGRYCIPVKQEYRSNFPGMIHDQSSTGSTIFVEPMSVVTLNNELKELEAKEQTEIEKILANLSEQVGFEKDAIASDLSTLVTLDFIFAKASLAKSYNGTLPLFSKEHYIEIKKGRHPLLDKGKVVPLDIHLGKDFSMLVVTGPNTGGKTVSLKTVGLFCLMGQAGLLIPASEGSVLTVFDDVFADIGDEQSIEQNLSTFSSHMTHIVSILEQVTPNCLCLFDELGGGTDPTEGAALAISILTHLHNQQVLTMATTHYSELKLFALSTPGISNASCEFDVETLQPTYRLLIGIPGKSNAFAISKKIGLPDYIIEDAKSRIDIDHQYFEDLLSDLENSKKALEQEQETIRKYKQEIESLQASLKSKKSSFDEKQQELLKQAREEAREIISAAKETADETIRKFNQWQKHPEKGDLKSMEAQRSKVRGKLKDLDSKLAYQPKAAKGKHKPEDFKIGDLVHVASLSLDGRVTTLPNSKGDLYVQMGILRSQVNIKDLTILDEPVITNEKFTKTQKGKVSIQKSATVSPSINLLGKNVSEAVAILDKYLDDAYLSHLTTVTIIHGKGTGALRNGIWQYLKRQPNIKSFRSGEFGEGDAGVTIVEFK